MGFLIYLAMTAALIYPLYILCPKYRLPAWFALGAIVPLGVIALLWVFAYRDDLKIPGVDT